MTAYYNENDKKAAEWLRRLISKGLIADGVVDTRSICDVMPTDLAGYDQCHFFAGIGGWSLALRLAGVPDDEPVWTGSCPCQPFSAAGKGLGTADKRHLWPEMRRLIKECRPAITFGEQVASKAGRQWLSGVRTDLEELGYGVGAADLCAAGVGAPHIRQRLYWVADCESFGRSRILGQGSRGLGAEENGEWTQPGPGPCSEDDRLADTDGGLARDGELQRGGKYGLQQEVQGAACGLEHADIQREDSQRGVHQEQVAVVAGELRAACGLANTEAAERRWSSGAEYGWRRSSQAGGPSYVDAWGDFTLVPCRDGKVRRIKSGIEPLATGLPGRLVRLRGYGNAIVPPLAAEFIETFYEARAVTWK